MGAMLSVVTYIYMHSMKKVLISSTVALSLLAPVLSQAAPLTQTQLGSVVSLLQSYGVESSTIGAVSRVLTAASSKPALPPGQVGKAACISLARDLRIGSQGEDVKKLQELLAEDSDVDYRSGATGFFGPMTAKAMMKFQTKHGIASTATGTVGPLTRGFLERACGLGLGNGNKGSEDEVEKGVVVGTITAATASTVTVQTRQNVQRVVNITAATIIKVFVSAATAPTTGSMSDLVVGKTVRAEGEGQTDGSLTAAHVIVGIVVPKVEDRVGDNSGRGNSGDDDNDDSDDDSDDDS